MDIIEALNQLKKPPPTSTKRIYLDNGLLSIADGVFLVALYRLGVSDEIALERLLEPVENRDNVLAMYSELYSGVK